LRVLAPTSGTISWPCAATQAIATCVGALVSLLQDWCEPFPGPFLYYPSRRQVPPALRAFIDFAADWRKRNSRSR
jgi:DNA-binding transcriptional LysR family regulator